jgi:hypothetical protein
MIVIGCTSEDYAKIKNQRIIDLQDKFKISSIKSKSAAIPLLINERYNGGISP